VKKVMDFAKFFSEEIRDKKKGLSGVHGKTGKRGYVGKMYTAQDFLKGKAKRDYRGTGKVVTFNMYAKIMPYEEFLLLPEEEKKRVLEGYRNLHKGTEIQKAWGHTSPSYLYKWIDELGLKKKNMKPRANKKAAPKKQEVQKSEPLKVEAYLEEIKEVAKELTPAPIPDGLNFTYNGNVDAERLIHILTKAGLLVEGETNKFSVKLEIQETE
jgi:transposase-like protein